MSLIKCPECNKEISDTSTQCIHCGYVLKKETNKTESIGKVIIHGYTEMFAVNPTVKVYKNNQYIAEIPRGETIELPIEEDTTFTFKCSIRKAEVRVAGNTTTEIMLSFNRGTGVLKAITNIQTDNAQLNNINKEAYNQSIEKQKNSNLIWLIIGIICLIVGILIL